MPSCSPCRQAVKTDLAVAGTAISSLIPAIPNALIVTACVLCFGRDYSEAVIHAVLTGFDTDCNGVTVGSIAGIACGADKIPDKWKTPVHQDICSSVNSYTRIPVEEIVKRTIAVSRTFRP